MKRKILTLSIILSTGIFMSSCSSKDAKTDDTRVENSEMAADSVTVNNLPDTVAQPEAINEDVAEESVESENHAEAEKLLGKYQELLKKCETIISKVKKGDLSAMADYTALQSELAQYQSKIDDLKSSLSPEQLTKFTKMVSESASISSKIEDAASKVHEKIDDAKTKAKDHVDEAVKNIDAIKGLINNQ